MRETDRQRQRDRQGDRQRENETRIDQQKKPEKSRIGRLVETAEETLKGCSAQLWRLGNNSTWFHAAKHGKVYLDQASNVTQMCETKTS